MTLVAVRNLFFHVHRYIFTTSKSTSTYECVRVRVCVWGGGLTRDAASLRQTINDYVQCHILTSLNQNVMAVFVPCSALNFSRVSQEIKVQISCTEDLAP
jgi:hypothetical protein